MNCQTGCACPRHFPNRRSIVAALACTAVLPAVARAQRGGVTAADDLRFMRMALDEARQGDFPFGAVIVREAR